MLEVTIESNRHIDQFFRRFAATEAEVRDNVRHALPEILRHRPHKIKTAYHLQRNGHPIHEYKIVLKHSINYRAAFTEIDQRVTVFFISDTLIKREFVKLLGHTNLVD
ncbi:MAG: hypothetical protein RR101_03245 [Burkholderiaceae bacterium]